MVVEGGVGGALEGFGDGAAEEEGEDFVGGGVGVDLVEGEDDERVLHEVLVGEERSEELLGPGGGVGDGGIMAVVGHVRGDERPLRELFVLELRLKVDEALNGASARGVGRDGLIERKRVVLANVVVGKVVLV